MKNKEKLEAIQRWLLIKYNIKSEISKTNSLYFYISNKDLEGSVKISNHQLVENLGIIKVGAKNYDRYLRINEVENYKLYIDGDDFSFKSLEKYNYEYGESKPAPDYWLAVGGNWSVEKLKNSIRGNIFGMKLFLEENL